RKQEIGTKPLLPEYTFIRGMIVCKDNTQLTPYQYYPVTKEEHDRILFEEYPDKAVFANTRTPYCESGVLISHDDGKTHQRAVACRMSMYEGWIWSEPTLAELSDGTIVMLMRKCRSGWLWRCDSADGGKTWSKVYNAGIPNPSNKPKLINMKNGKIALLNVPNNIGRERYPLELWISDDDMKTWKYKKSLSDIRASYSYSDGFYENGHIMFSIEKDRKTILFFDVDVDEA
ncbi:MAG: exo-alpha-sialidase, partial [Actinobacteria bacterium]|nr:exo-alpha-sialidase [Actinomycetota bacterium]